MTSGTTFAGEVGAFQVMDAMGQDLGLEWKPSKDCGGDQPRQELEFLLGHCAG
jgi:hypothetical protein